MASWFPTIMVICSPLSSLWAGATIDGNRAPSANSGRRMHGTFPTSGPLSSTTMLSGNTAGAAGSRFWRKKSEALGSEKTESVVSNRPVAQSPRQPYDDLEIGGLNFLDGKAGAKKA